MYPQSTAMPKLFPDVLAKVEEKRSKIGKNRDKKRAVRSKM